MEPSDRSANSADRPNLMSVILRGQCLCGAVSIRASASGRHVDACHCTMCRRWGGGPLLVVRCAEDMQLDGVEHVTRYRSSGWAERGFCSGCGTHLYFRLIGGGFLAISAGLVDVPADWRLTTEVFVEEQPAYYQFAGETRRLIGEGDMEG
ncbi:GFA family protein [Aquisalimonas sp.]|uniref:GFA family protein n=1 Tax=Aquisalimonas sp. TaxID=1872621 RepID=UPI003452F023